MKAIHPLEFHIKSAEAANMWNQRRRPAEHQVASGSEQQIPWQRGVSARFYGAGKDQTEQRADLSLLAVFLRCGNQLSVFIRCINHRYGLKKTQI